MTSWYLVAILIYPLSASPIIKINTALKFDSLEQCNTYYNTYKESLEKGLKRTFPKAKSLEIKCKGL